MRRTGGLGLRRAQPSRRPPRLTAGHPQVCPTAWRLISPASGSPNRSAELATKPFFEDLPPADAADAPGNAKSR